MIKILFNDGLEEELREKLINDGILVCDKHYEEDELSKVLSEFDCIVIRSATKIKTSLIDKVLGGRLKLIIRAGVGMDNIDVSYAKECGIEVLNTANASSNAVTELVLAHIFTLSRFMFRANLTMKKGEWNKRLYTGLEISGKTLGIIGMGRIGKVLADKASALGMKVIYFNRSERHDIKSEYKAVTIEELYKNSDFISLHVGGTETIISDDEINSMKDGVFIINTARASLIKTEALLVGINSGKVAGAGIDVFDNEPRFSQALVNNIKISATPHIGASTVQAQGRIAEEVYKIIKDRFI